MFKFVPAKYSPLELQYLKDHIDDPIMELAGLLGKSANSIKNKIKEIKTGVKPTSKSSKGTKIGVRKDLNMFFRSGWEANIARYLKHIGAQFEYEPTTFSFIEHGVKHGTVSYTPDFKIYSPNNPLQYKYWEVKGYLKPEDRTKINRFKKYYPKEWEKLCAVTGSKTNKTGKFFEKIDVPIILEYNELNKQYKDIIPNWE
jgi:hypothetical protein